MKSIILILVCGISRIAARSTGAPESTSCDSMDPSHDQGTQTSTAPFTVTVTTTGGAQVTQYAVGQDLKVTITPNTGQTFKGLLLKARRVDPMLDRNQPIGEFAIPSAGISKFQQICKNTARNVITHKNPNVISSAVAFTWKTSAMAGHIEFVATIVETKNRFWTNVKTGTVNDPNAGPISQALQVGTDTGPEIDVGTCGNGKGCYTQPNDCSGSSCNLIVTWKKKSGGSDFSFEMSSKTDNYVALGFSSDKSMGSDSVISCVKKSSGVRPENSKNSGKSNAATTDAGITNAFTADVNGGIRCRFDHNLKGGDGKNLADSFYLFLASGPVSGDSKGQHKKTPVISGSKAKLGDMKKVTGSQSKPWLIKLHGAGMMLAWVTCASIGMMMARYFKEIWPDSTLCGQKVWFSIHRACMISVFILTATATGLIFGHVKGYSDLKNAEPKIVRAHPILGLIVVGLAVINPTMALFRPHPGTPNRPIFNWLHWGVGTLAHIVACVTVFIGFELPSAEAVVPDWLKWLMVGFVVFHVLCDLILEAHKCMARNKAEKTNNMEMHAMNTQHTAPKNDDSFRPIVFVVYAVGVVGIGATLAIVVLAQ